jgi:Pyruvate/2-oxoacid:ferredoxin oxidoreductase gamma subunit
MPTGGGGYGLLGVSGRGIVTGSHMNDQYIHHPTGLYVTSVYKK